MGLAGLLGSGRGVDGIPKGLVSSTRSPGGRRPSRSDNARASFLPARGAASSRTWPPSSALSGSRVRSSACSSEGGRSRSRLVTMSSPPPPGTDPAPGSRPAARRVRSTRPPHPGCRSLGLSRARPPGVARSRSNRLAPDCWAACIDGTTQCVAPRRRLPVGVLRTV